jgi:uncharacterized membrane-anchored protein YhcB (DUF1043 family)
MASDDLLQQLDTLIQKRLEENNKHIQQNIKAEVDPLHERLDAQREQIATVKTELSELIIQEAGAIANLIVDHDTQIEELQKAVGLRPKH